MKATIVKSNMHAFHLNLLFQEHCQLFTFCFRSLFGDEIEAYVRFFGVRYDLQMMKKFHV